MTTELVTTASVTTGWPLSVEPMTRERATRALPLTVELVTAESTTMDEPFTLLASIVDCPETFDWPLTAEPLIRRAAPETIAAPHTAELSETNTDGSTLALVATAPPPLPCGIVGWPPQGPDCLEIPPLPMMTFPLEKLLPLMGCPLQVQLPLVQTMDPSHVKQAPLVQTVPA